MGVIIFYAGLTELAVELSQYIMNILSLQNMKIFSHINAVKHKGRLILCVNSIMQCQFIHFCNIESACIHLLHSQIDVQDFTRHMTHILLQYL